MTTPTAPNTSIVKRSALKPKLSSLIWVPLYSRALPTRARDDWRGEGLDRQLLEADRATYAAATERRLRANIAVQVADWNSYLRKVI